MKKLSKIVLRKAVKWLVIAAVAWLGWTQLSGWLNRTFSWQLPELTFGPLQPDPVMGYKSDQIVTAITGASREKAELIVYEQDVQVDSQVTDTFLNISWFTKTQTIHSFGTGIYVVDLSGLSADDVAVDTTANTITVTVPHARLKTVVIDITRTTFDDIERNIFGWGDITLTPAQQQQVQQGIQQAMDKACSGPTYIAAAEQSAADKIAAVYRSVLTKLDGDTAIDIVFP